MREENQQKRRAQIEQAAYDLFEQKGYAGTSMLSVAKRAKASNETLYRWYGDKHGLFLSLIERNLTEVREVLQPEGQTGNDPQTTLAPLKTLECLGPKLLGVLVNTRAIALNRAAAADASGALGQALAKGGRDTVVPMIQSIFADLIAEMGAKTLTKSEAAELYVNLLVGDLQVRRVIGVIPPLSEAEIKARSTRACQMVMKLLR